MINLHSKIKSCDQLVYLLKKEPNERRGWFEEEP